MAISATGDVLSTVVQLQFLQRKGAFAVPFRMKWLPGGLQGASLPDDVRNVYEPLKQLLKVDLKKISRGEELPEDTAQRIRQFDRGLVGLRFAEEPWKVKLAEELLEVLLDETTPLSDAQTQLEPESDNGTGPPEAFVAPTWFMLYRMLRDGPAMHLDEARSLIQFLGKLPESQTSNALAWSVFLLRRTPASQMAELVRRLSKVQAEHPGCWSDLFGDGWRDFCHQHYDHRTQLQAMQAMILVVGDLEGLPPKRNELLQRTLASCRRQPKSFPKIAIALAEVCLVSGLADDVAELFADDIATLPHVLRCIAKSSKSPPASRDAQLLIARILGQWPVADNKVFRHFCQRIAELQLSVNLRSALHDRLMANRKLLQALVQRTCDAEKLADQVRSAGDYNKQLFGLLLLGLQTLEGADLRDASRGLSLIDVAIRQNKIDSRHLGLLMDDFKQQPVQALGALADDMQLDVRTGGNQELFNLYLTLRILNQTVEQVDGHDMDHISNTLRKIRVRDSRARGD